MRTFRVGRQLVDSSPQVMLLAINFHEDFINEEGIAIISVLYTLED